MTQSLGLNLAVIIIACINDLNPPLDTAVLLDHLTSAATFMTLGSTLLTTSLIAYRIYSVSQESKAHLQRRPFVAILDAFVQSAAAYTLVSLLFAIEGVVPFTRSTGATLFNLQGYTFPLFSTTAVCIYGYDLPENLNRGCGDGKCEDSSQKRGAQDAMFLPPQVLLKQASAILIEE